MGLTPRLARGFLRTGLLLLLWCAPAAAVKVDQLAPGHTYRVDKIVFTGNHAIPDSDLLSHLTTKERPFYLIWQKRPVFDYDVFTEDLKRLALYYRTRGYFQTHIDYDLKLDGDLITPQIKITEHGSVRVEQVRIMIDGKPLPPTDRLYAKLPVKPGQVFDSSAYQTGEEVVRDYYRNESYAQVTIQRRAEVNISEDAVRVWYFAQPGVIGVFGKTTVQGASEVAIHIIRREFTYRRGEAFSQRKLDESRDRLLKLGLFSVVRFTPHPDRRDPRLVPIRLTVRERPRHSIDIGGGYNTESQFIANFAWHDMNWMGGGRQLTAYLRYRISIAPRG